MGGPHPNLAGSQPLACAVLTELYERDSGVLTSYLSRLVSSHDLAEDLCQEAFLRAWQHWSSGGPPAEARAWLYRVATNLAYDELRRRQRRGEYALLEHQLASSTAQVRLQQIEDQDQIVRLLDTLAPEVAALLVAQFAHGRPLHELARHVGSPEGTIKSHISRARARLRARLELPS
ncbi:MAG: RNA polymerase sigma factor [Chloroflexales bacterium]|nr:RNA polymerase sigma factor [Chloroflexales bacterium]